MSIPLYGEFGLCCTLFHPGGLTEGEKRNPTVKQNQKRNGKGGASNSGIRTVCSWAVSHKQHTK